MKARLHMTAMAVCCTMGWLSPAAALAQKAEGLSVCRTGTVEMIVGGVAAAPSSCSPRTGAARASPALAEAGAQHRPVVSVRLDEGADDRRRILEAELQRELSRSNDLARQSNTPEGAAALTRSRADVAALRQELARVGVSSH